MNNVLQEILDEINTPNRGTCDYFIVDRIEAIIKREIGKSDEALEGQEPCEDTISREALNNAISDLTYWHFENGRLIAGGGGNKAETVYKADDVMRLTHILPSVTPQHTRWIPVSERLPEKMGAYLVTLEYKEHGLGVTTLWFHGSEIGWDLRVADIVIAWMPLPLPWKGE